MEPWALELWKATEEKRAALVALKRSEETLHQVWRQVQPPWLGPPIGAPSAAPLREETPCSPVKGGQEVKGQSRCERARVRAAASLRAGGATRTSKPPEEPLTGEETSRPQVRGRSPCEQGTSAEGDRKINGRQERCGPVSPIEPVREEQPQVGAPWPLKTIKQEQPRSVSYTRPTGPERAREEGPCRPGSVKQEGPEDLQRPQAEAPCRPRPVKREEGETGWAEYQEN